MRASSLIFVVIFAVWAASMLKHWVRRRDDLATARTVDRFSEAMRMLERKAPVKADTSARPASAPQATVLRPVVTAKPAKEAREAAAAGQTVETSDVATGRAATVRRVVASSSQRLASPQIKAGALLGSLVFFVLASVLAIASVVSGWWVLASLVTTIGVVAWLRRSAIAARQGRRTAPQSVRTSQPVRRSQPVREQASAGMTSHGATAVQAPVQRPTEQRDERAASPLVTPVPAETEIASSAATETVFDQEPADAVARAQAEVFDARQWEPVEVPRPTYTMKAKAEREEVAPAATVDQTDSRPLAARYENTPVDELPFDGMALDEDYDDLPQVYRAG